MASSSGSAVPGGNQRRRMGFDFGRRNRVEGNDRSRFGGSSQSEGRAVNAAMSLITAERQAGEETTSVEESLDGARENESAANGFYSGDGKEDKNEVKGGAGFLKKKGPIGLIIGLIFGVGGIMGVSQLSQPFSLIENFRETFNSMQTSVDVRSNTFFRMQMDSGRTINPLRAKLFGGSKFKITKKQASKLSSQGIYVDDDFKVDIEGRTETFRVLKFDDGTGELKIVAADARTASRLNRVDLSALDADATLGMKFNKDAISFVNLYASNSDFYYGYNKGSKTWRGAISGWFDSVTANFLSRNKLTRNLFKNWQQEVARAGEGNTKTVATDMIAAEAEGRTEEGSFESKNRGEGEPEMNVDENGNPTTPKTDDNGNIIYKTEIDPETGKPVTTTGSNGISKVSSVDEVRAKLNDISSKFSGVSGAASAAANYTCMVVNVVGGISLLVSASEALQIINLVTAYFEAIDKVKAGQGAESPINELAGALNETKEVEYSSFELGENSLNLSGDITEENVEGAFKQVKKTKTGSAMTSSGIASIYGGGAVDPNDPSVKSFNFTSSINTILGGLGTSMAAFSTCSVAKMSAAVVGAVGDAIEIIGCVAGLIGAAFTFGASSSACGPLIASTVVTIGVSIGAGILIGGIISAITPMVAQTLTRDLITNIGGEDLGNALTSGANMYMGNTHRANGGSLGTSEAYAAFKVAQEEVIANNARYERMDRSPFDATSQYTFLGTLINQLAAFSSANSLTSLITSSGSVISSAITSLIPTSTAVEISNNLIPNYDTVCPYLASIGAVGDAYCNPYIITDMSTMDEDPADLIIELEDNFEDKEGDNVTIKKDSKLAEYIVRCSNRTSAFGIADQSIASEYDGTSVDTDSATFNNAANGAIGALPVIGDTLDIVSNATQLAHAGYISGESCVAGNTDSSSDTPGWEVAKKYQRFIEDQTLAETMGLIEESAVTAYLDDYYEENPLDQSYEGILARYSGLEKEDVIALLDIIEYGNYIANYDPSTRYAFTKGVEVPGEQILFEESELRQVVGSPVYAFVYTDLRNRNFVA